MAREEASRSVEAAVLDRRLRREEQEEEEEDDDGFGGLFS